MTLFPSIHPAGDDYQVTLPPLVAAAPSAVPAQEGNEAATGGASRASEFHDGTVDFDEDGLGSGSRMYQ